MKTEQTARVLWLGIGPGAVGPDSETAYSGDLCSTTLSQVLSLPLVPNLATADRNFPRLVL